eukprot:CAMPEP_0206217338 /NCGR_PEP_ID=MMETSP0047_2-20121206/3223_1 /ASSEMBLY_ACC=CAM_ASM_000192 /TAXON_ID=195065 /ORGANISM="Chroomonas mesostigmatica_cf, Strain CCMP1168" /LENGTH=55 /DNA_ID=CAMNT_0053639789 /DNA_START=369 /DNA_END=536 /DNA_ORIENTATION=-
MGRDDELDHLARVGRVALRHRHLEHLARGDVPRQGDLEMPVGDRHVDGRYRVLVG